MTRWQPLLTGDVAERAKRTAREVGEAIVAACSATGPVNPRESILDRGDAGLALALAYLHRAGLADSVEPAGAFLERAMTAVSEHEMDHTLMRGFTGIGWVANHLIETEPEADDPCDGIDDGVRVLLEDGPPLHFDVIEGLAGVGAYALSRAPRPVAHHLMELIVQRLASTCERLPDGMAWRTAPDAPGADPDRFPGGSYSLGFARGVPGVIAFLAGALRHGVATALAGELIEGAVAWTLAQRVEHPAALYPIHVAVDGHGRDFARPAWCFGDIGVAMGLLSAARAAGRVDWERAAIAAARASVVTTQAADIRDAGFCHGAIGLGHMLGRIAAATGDAELAAGAVRWFEQCLDMRDPARGYAGFASATPAGVLDDSGRASWSLLFGAAGAAVGLACAATDVAPKWDQVLLVDPPSVT